MAHQHASKPKRVLFFLSCLAALVFFSCNKEKIDSAPEPFQIYIKADRVIQLPTNSVSLLASSDNRNLGDGIEGSRYQYIWDCVQLPNGSSQPVFSSPTARKTGVYSLGLGRYTFRLRATGPGGFKAEDTLALEVLPDSLSGLVKIYDAVWNTTSGPWFDLVSARLTVPEFAGRPDNTLPDVTVDADSSGQWKVLPWNFGKGVLAVYAPQPADDDFDSVVWENYFKLVGRKLKVRVRF